MSRPIWSRLVLPLLFGSAFALSPVSAWAILIFPPDITLPAGLPDLGVGTNGKTIVGSVTAGQSLTISGITIASSLANPRISLPLQYSWVFDFDSGDNRAVVTGVTQSGGTCVSAMTKLLPNTSCTLNLTFSTPNFGNTGDFGISYITLTAFLFQPTYLTGLTFDIQVNDTVSNVPEPISLALLSPGLLALGMIRRRKGA